MAPCYIHQLPTMLLTFFGVALLIASGVSQKQVKRPGFADQLPKPCPGREEDMNYSRITLSLFALFNQARYSIATGMGLPGVQKRGETKLMYGARYSCGLETNASSLLEAGETTLPAHVVLSFKSTQGSSLSGKIADVFKQMKKDGSGREMLTFPNVPYFGCAYSYENRSQPLSVLCVFKSDSNEDPSRNSPCSSDSHCTKYDGSTCSDKLCWAPSE